MAFIRGSLRRPGGVNHKETEADDSALEHMESDKAECEREIRKAVWHVFNSLDIAQSGNVPVSQLKVRFEFLFYVTVKYYRIIISKLDRSSYCPG